MTTPHPSHLELDRYQLGVPLPASVATHVGTCARCRAHLAAIAPTSDVPAWVHALERPQRPRARALSGMFGALAVAAVAMLISLRPTPATTPYVGSKGAPSVRVHVQHEATAGAWDGGALTPGDRIRLEIAPDAFDHLTVLSVADEQAPVVLYRGTLTPHRHRVLPTAWQLDAEAKPEQLAVIFSHRALAADESARLLVAHDAREVAVVRLVLPKRLP